MSFPLSDGMEEDTTGFPYVGGSSLIYEAYFNACRTTAGTRGIARVSAAVVGDVVRPVAPHLDHSARRQHRIMRTLSSQGTSTATRCSVASSTC